MPHDLRAAFLLYQAEREENNYEITCEKVGSESRFRRSNWDHCAVSYNWLWWRKTIAAELERDLDYRKIKCANITNVCESDRNRETDPKG
jgi:hypothetical protein